MAKVIQFNWRRHWSKKVVPNLDKELVQASLDFGMRMLDPQWKRGDPPYLLGAISLDGGRVIPGKLSWYQPWNRCHWIAFFSMAIGVLNYPDLEWRFISGYLHTVPVGFGADGQPKVVMDILLFEIMEAEESIDHASEQRHDTPEGKEWNRACHLFVHHMVPRLRASAENRPADVA